MDIEYDNAEQGAFSTVDAVIEEVARGTEANQDNVEELEPEPEEEDDADPDERVIYTQPRSTKRTRITQLQFYSYLMAIRPEFNNVLAWGSLTQQWMVDSYVKIESNRLKYLREHQSDHHVARYQGLADYLNNRADMGEFTIGNVYILPSSFIGSPRAMKKAYQESWYAFFIDIASWFKTLCAFAESSANPHTL